MGLATMTREKMGLATMTREKMVPRAVMLKQSQRGRGTQRSCNGFEGIKKGIHGKKEMVQRWQKVGYVLCKECEAERDTDDGLRFHSCARNDPLIAGFRTKAGPIACPPENTVRQDSAIAERIGWTPWSWQWPCVHARLDISCRC